MTVLRRLDAVLMDSKPNVLEMKAVLDQTGVVEQDAALRQTAGQAFYNTSKFTLHDLRPALAGSSSGPTSRPTSTASRPTCKTFSRTLSSATRSRGLSKADALGALIEKLTSPDVNLSLAPVKHDDGSVRSPGLDNHGMGSIFEELVRRFNEENNEEAGEHWTPRDAVRLMAKLVFLPVADELKSGTYLLYDGACGTGAGCSPSPRRRWASSRPSTARTSRRICSARRSTPRPTPSARADLLLKGEGEAADNIVGGPEHSTLANDAFPSHEFDFKLSNPPYGKSWKTDLERIGGKKDMRDPRFVIEHAGDPDYSLAPPSCSEPERPPALPPTSSSRLRSPIPTPATPMPARWGAFSPGAKRRASSSAR